MTDHYLGLVDVVSGERTLLLPKGGELVVYQAAFLIRSVRDFMVYAIESQSICDWFILICDGAIHGSLGTWAEPIDSDMEQICLWHDERKLAFTVDQNGINILHVLDGATR